MFLKKASIPRRNKTESVIVMRYFQNDVLKIIAMQTYSESTIPTQKKTILCLCPYCSVMILSSITLLDCKYYYIRHRTNDMLQL